MKKTLPGLLFFLVFTAVTSQAQVTTTAVPFLQIAPDSRSSGFGEGGVAMAGKDPNTIFWNPAALYRIQEIKASITHSNWLPQLTGDLFYDYLALVYPLGPDLGSLGGHITFLNLGENVQTSASGKELGRFVSWEMAVGVSYGVPLDEDWSIGTGGRFIYSRLSPVAVENEKGRGVASGFGVDLAFEYHPSKFILGLPYPSIFEGSTDSWFSFYELADLSNRFRWGTNISNIGPKMTYIDDAQADPLPTKFRTGIAYRLIDDEYYYLDSYVEMAKLLVSNQDSLTKYPVYKAVYKAWYKDGFVNELNKANLMMGAEFVYDNYVSLRAGFFYEDKDAGNRKFMTYGAGILYSFLNVDFSYISAFEEAHPLAGTVRVTLGLNVTSVLE
ncbi:MAG: PorV/PorQ family protein [Bacteroidetes bacterium]|nr:PorV/PorQ family protein [Bacteroidota bacterium]